MGFPIAIGQFFAVAAMVMAKKLAVVTPFQFSSIIVGYLVSIFRYEEKVNIICLIGGAAIMLGVIFILRYKDESKF